MAPDIPVGGDVKTVFFRGGRFHRPSEGKVSREMKSTRFSLVLLGVGFVLGVAAQKKPLDHSVYDSWRSIRNQALSNDGRWALWIEAPQVGDADLLIAPTSGGERKQLPRPSNPRFSSDSRFVVYLTVPPEKEVKQAQKEKRKPKDMPRNTLSILDLSTGDLKTIESVQSFSLPDRDTGWLFYQPYFFAEEGTQAESAPPKEEGAQQPGTPQHRKSQRPGTDRVLLNLSTGEEIRIPFVTNAAWFDDGKRLAYTVSHEEPSADGVYVFNVETRETTAIIKGIGDYRGLTVHSKSGHILFTSDHEDYPSEKPTRSVYLYSNGRLEKLDLNKGIAEEGFVYAERAQLRFSESGNRLFFGAEPQKESEEKKEEPSDEEKVVVDIWHYKDPLLQPMQLLRANQERNRTYLAVYDVRTRRAHLLESPDLPRVTTGTGDGDWALGFSDIPYRQLISWDQTYNDVYLVNLNTGEATLVIQKLADMPSLSPSGRWLLWYDEREGHWRAMDTIERTPINLTAEISVPFSNELHDYPALPSSYGTAGWTKDEEWILLYDRYDIWAVDPNGRREPFNITRAFGRTWDINLRIINLDREARTVDLDQPLLLSAFSERTKQSGFYRFEHGFLRKLIMEDKRYGPPQKAKDADVLLLTREDFQEFPNLWVTDTDLQRLTRISDANPQQAEYLWGTEELVTWLSNDGVPLQGVLLKPENFDSTQKYPMIVYFYERLSDNLHRHYVPSPGSSSINPTFYVSRGYVIFMPDIPYKVGYPGESAMSAILPGVQSIVRRGFVDPKRIGLQGHSWGGYQVTYLVTRTNLFACAEAGAPVANMFSAYGGIRWGSGMSRMFQYEKTQSRIGGTIWEMPLRFIENSPIFWLDKVETPLLILHNDQDGAVPWYQGIELFTALRRLGKPAWMFNYNGEDHGLNKRVNRVDWTIRMQQFFDHFLKGDPAPVWLAEGIPATKKGEDLGLQPAKGRG